MLLERVAQGSPSTLTIFAISDQSVPMQAFEIL
jgi:hypothetical protein